MTRLTRKYEFVDEAAADAAIALLPTDDEGNPTGEHLVTILGFLVLCNAPALINSVICLYVSL